MKLWTCQSLFLLFLSSIILSSSALRVFVVDEDDSGKPSLYSVQLIDPDDSASEQKTKTLFSSSTFSEVAPGIAFNFENNKVFFPARLSVIPNDHYRSLKMSVDGKNLRSINSLCDSDLSVIATSDDYTYTVDSNLTLWQGGIDNATEMNQLMNLGTKPPTFMKFYDDSLYYTTGSELYQIRFDNTSQGYVPVDEQPKLLFTPPQQMNQFDFDPKKPGMFYYATTKQIMSLNLTMSNLTAEIFIKGLKAPIGLAVAEDPYYLLYTDTDALIQYDMESKSSEELEVFTHTYGIAISSAPSSLSLFSYGVLFSVFFLNFLLVSF